MDSFISLSHGYFGLQLLFPTRESLFTTTEKLTLWIIRSTLSAITENEKLDVK